MTAITAPANRVTFPRVVASEWVKLRTLRSSYWCAALIVVLTVGVALLIATFANQSDAELPTSAQKSLQVGAVTLGSLFTQLIACIFGVLMIGGEYGSGMIRTTFLAVPRRWPAIIAKALVLAVTVFVVTTVATLLAALVTLPLFAAHGVGDHLGDWSVLQPMLGAGLYLALLAAFSLLVGAIVRNSAAGIAITLALVLVVPTVLSLMSGVIHADWPQNVVALLPSSLGQQLYSYTEGIQGGVTDGLLHVTPPFAALAMIGWVALAGVIAVPLVRTRDA